MSSSGTHRIGLDHPITEELTDNYMIQICFRFYRGIVIGIVIPELLNIQQQWRKTKATEFCMDRGTRYRIENTSELIFPDTLQCSHPSQHSAYIIYYVSGLSKHPC